MARNILRAEQRKRAGLDIEKGANKGSNSVWTTSFSVPQITLILNCPPG